jgi:MerR family Zn(II)-responsive transcriptional regulator of zntA
MRIGELAAATGTTATTLRFYERAGILSSPRRTPAGYRDYDDAAVARVDFVRRGREAGLTLAQLREVIQFRDGPSPRSWCTA